MGGLFELQFAALNVEGVDLFAVDIDDGVLERGIVRLEVEVNSAKRLLFVVAEKRVLDEAVHVLIGQARGLALV